jgi:uncharacterized protein YgiM (DUF1202 family)
MKKALGIAAFLVFVSCSMAFAAQEIYYVQSLKAKVMWEPSFKASVMREVQKGHALTALGKEGSWIKVKIDFETGYISALVMSKQPPLNRVALIKAEDQDIRQGVRRRASTYSSAAAARGLTQEGRKRLSKEEKADYFNLEKIESITVSREAVEKFMEGGAL